MHPLNKGFLYTTCCALAFGLSANSLAQEEPASPRNSQSVASSELPDSPGTAWSKAQDSSTQQSSSSQTASPASGQTTQTAPSQDEGQKPQRPIGTAAAEAPKAKGVTAAQPAGVAIARSE